jgi:hypothetical protein
MKTKQDDSNSSLPLDDLESFINSTEELLRKMRERLKGLRHLAVTETAAGIKLRKRSGRPKGSGRHFSTKSEFLAALQSAIQSLRQQGRPVTQETVASYLSQQEGNPTFDDRQLRRWIRDFDVDWQEVKKRTQIS